MRSPVSRHLMTFFRGTKREDILINDSVCVCLFLGFMRTHMYVMAWVLHYNNVNMVCEDIT